MPDNKFPMPQSPVEMLNSADGGAAFIALLTAEPHNWRGIPLVNYTPLHELKDQSVVRFRGMIQDMSNPEIYCERYEVRTKADENELRLGKYRDRLDIRDGEQLDMYAESSAHGTRRNFFVVSVPGLNKWAVDFEVGLQKNCPSANEVTALNTAAGIGKKRSADEQEANKRLRVSENETNSDSTNTAAVAGSLSAEYLVNSPIPERPGKACMVKIYEDFDKYLLNSIVDVVGFLSIDPSLDASTMEVDDDDLENVTELRAQNPPPSLIPRLHAIAVHVLPHANPLLDQRLSCEGVQPDGNTHKDLRMLLNLVLFNDELAADYLLSHLISTVYNRTEMQSIGKFTLNLCNIPQEILENYTSELYKILEMLIPASHYLPLSLDILNTATFLPKKDYESNKLASGLLQLAPHTHLVLDETQMNQGKLDASGVIGLQNLANLINNQQIKCDFRYYDIDYDVDVPVLVLSEGRSMLPNDFVVPLKADRNEVNIISETLKAAHQYLDVDRLEKFRRFLTLAKLAKFNMNSERSEMVQTDFVEMRKAKIINGADELHALLVLSRLLGTARGRNELDRECWELAKKMETERKTRIEALPKSKIRTNIS